MVMKPLGLKSRIPHWTWLKIEWYLYMLFSKTLLTCMEVYGLGLALMLGLGLGALWRLLFCSLLGRTSVDPVPYLAELTQSFILLICTNSF